MLTDFKTIDFYKSFLKDNGLNEKQVPKSLYFKIIKEVNKEYVRQMIEEGKVLRYYLNFQIQPVKFLRKIKSVNDYTGYDFHASKIKKQQLIEQGLTPLENYRNEKGEITGNNGGVNWLVEYTDLHFYGFRFMPCEREFNSVSYKFCKFKPKALISKMLNGYAKKNPTKASNLYYYIDKEK